MPTPWCLHDDKDFFPSYLCGNVVRSEVLEEHPELRMFSTSSPVRSERRYGRMNYEVEVEGKEPRDVAEAFLEERGKGKKMIQ
jgi:osmoprotectant transport system permease protein